MNSRCRHASFEALTDRLGLPLRSSVTHPTSRQADRRLDPGRSAARLLRYRYQFEATRRRGPEADADGPYTSSQPSGTTIYASTPARSTMTSSAAVGERSGVTVAYPSASSARSVPVSLETSGSRNAIRT